MANRCSCVKYREFVMHGKGTTKYRSRGLVRLEGKKARVCRSIVPAST